MSHRMDENGRPHGRGGDPTGSPGTDTELRDLARRHVRQAIDTILAVMGNARTPAAARLAAAEIILDRAWGRARQGMDPKAALDFVDVLRSAVAIRARREDPSRSGDARRDDGGGGAGKDRGGVRH
ncbi:hypothetical protein FHP25_39195 [Vineibacter terrae]|uniref:RsbT co-antagonist protein RsbRD N-terminal domain-containing protein n=1 Tax=Vineibacter terrae TaxID=2586908 RepID=A0A5C8P6R3_9HYPH|nr:hypothetical protein [Vineibacter terrae]TXL69376.1 hypothetical protein FHP25_39195 [Vineibacter terrae]